MRLLTGVLRGLAACLAGTAAAEDAARPETTTALLETALLETALLETALLETAPLEYARVCDASGSAYLVIPGTEVCLVLGGPRRGGVDNLGPPPVTNDASPFAPGSAGAMTGLATGRGEESWTERGFLGTRVPRRAELLAYTATFGDGFSASISFEDPASRPGVDLGTIASRPDADPISINGISAPSFRAARGGEVPEIVGNIRQDQPLGAVQLDAAALQAHAGLFTSQAPTSPSPAYPIPAPTNSHGLGVQGGVQPNMDYLSPGDRLWLQAAYENGAYGTIAGSSTGSGSTEAEAARFGRAVVAPFDSVYGWRPQASPDCTWSGSSACAHRRDQEGSPDASKRSLLPTFSSAVFGPPQDVRYAPSAIAGFGGTVAMPKLEDAKAGPSFIGMPVTGFDIGAEFMYINVKQARPAAAPASADPPSSAAASAPTVKTNPAEYQGRLRVQRAF